MVKRCMVNGRPISRFAKPFHEASVMLGEGPLYGGQGRKQTRGHGVLTRRTPVIPPMKARFAMKMKAFALALALPLSSLLSGPASAADVTLIVKGADPGGANVMASLCTQAEFLKRCTLRQKMSATEKTVTLLFKDVPPGTYAASAFQDINDDTKLGRGTFGAPNEPWAVSNDAKGIMGPPAFDDAKFEVGDKPVTLKLDLD